LSKLEANRFLMQTGVPLEVTKEAITSHLTSRYMKLVFLKELGSLAQ
jgi:hypothetical protein